MPHKYKVMEAPPRFKYFNGKEYILYDYGGNKFWADTHKRKLKLNGFYVRMITKPNIYDARAVYYLIYIRRNMRR